MLLHPVGTTLNDLIGICSILQYWGMAKINKNDDKSKWGMSPIRKSHVYNKHHKITQTIKMLQRESCVLERCQDCHRIRNYIYSDPKRKKIPLDRKRLQKHAIRSTKIYIFFFLNPFLIWKFQYFCTIHLKGKNLCKSIFIALTTMYPRKKKFDRLKEQEWKFSYVSWIFEPKH